MKQLVILSGKGGTGKTSVTAAFAHLAASSAPPLPVVIADADVDAANLEMVLSPQTETRTDFWGGQVAQIDPDMCANCGTCMEVCRFDAISYPSPNPPEYPPDTPLVDPIACDGCAACVYQCPEGAIEMEAQLAGAWFQSQSAYGALFHAALRPAQENSGKLVTVVRQNARLWALDHDQPLILIDGPPGIGCPVISAVSGADYALIVAEPTLAGEHDMQRVLDTTRHFGVEAQVCVNKADLYPEGTARIEAFCSAQEIEIIGRIPYDPAVTAAMVQGLPVTAFQPDTPASQALAGAWARLMALLEIEHG